MNIKKIIKIKKTIFILICILFIISGRIPIYNNQSINIDNIQYVIKDFKPFKIGNPLGNEDNKIISKRYYGKSTRWWCACIGPSIFIFCSYLLYVYQRKKFCNKYCNCHSKEINVNIENAKIYMIRYKKFCFLCVLMFGGIGYGIGRGIEAYYGRPFDYAAYQVPNEAADIVFWFSGADEGACGYKDFGSNCDYCYASKEYGYEQVAMFNFNDVDKAIDYARKLPIGTRLIVRGHSSGAASAVKFVTLLSSNVIVLLLDTRDPISWFGRIREKPSNVVYWRNVLPGDTHIIGKQEFHKGTRFIGHIINCANLDMMIGGPWGLCCGAHNVILPNKDHHEISRCID